MKRSVELDGRLGGETSVNAEPSLAKQDSLAHDAAGQMTRRIVVFDYVDAAAFRWITLNQGQRAIGTEGLYRFRKPVEVVVVNLTLQYTVRILLHQVGRAVIVAIVLDFDKLVVAKGFDKIPFAVAVGIENELILIGRDSAHPLIGPSVLVSMGHNESVFLTTSGEEDCDAEQKRGTAHRFLYTPAACRAQAQARESPTFGGKGDPEGAAAWIGSVRRRNVLARLNYSSPIGPRKACVWRPRRLSRRCPLR